jgi:hypothetical protein
MRPPSEARTDTDHATMSPRQISVTTPFASFHRPCGPYDEIENAGSEAAILRVRPVTRPVHR